MRKINISLAILLLSTSLLQAYTQTQPDEKLFQEAKILIFDKKWEKAQEKLETLIDRYPDSTWFSQAVFYKAKCLEGQRGKEVEALEVYKSFIQLEERSKSLAEEAEVSIIDLAYDLYEDGERSYLREIERRLFNSNRVVKYYAAFKLSYVKDKKIAARAVPVLKSIAREGEDDEIRDRAKIALLRVDPSALKDFEEERSESRIRVLHLRVNRVGKREPVFSMDIPWALADLVFGAIPENEKEVMRKEGYDIDRVADELTRFRGKIIEIRGNGTIIKIWVD
ncbi:MAG: tetratricopeptide repeat protein [Candidatus Aminicenantes bacterium]|nr:MAG: tetratricopeptide repeat protein [Candidatus Aminicenantes bacterium]